MKENKLFKYLDTLPEIEDNVFLASGVKVIGDVKIGGDSSVWYNTVIRGDVNKIRIGNKTNIQDLSMLHVTFNDFPLLIGNEVTIGHSVTLHGCTLQIDFIGMAQQSWMEQLSNPIQWLVLVRLLNKDL